MSTTKTFLSPANGAPLAPSLHGCRAWFYGHSFGQQQSGPNVWAGSLYPARIRDLLHADTLLYQNQTVSGSTMAQIATKVSSTWTDGNGGLVSLLGNQNDVIAHTSATSFKASFRAILNTLLGSSGKPPTVLVIKDVTSTAAAYTRLSISDTDVATYNGYLDSVIAEFPTGWILVADPVGDGWNPATMTYTDGQHPNDLGMAFIVASCMKVLAGATYRPGQNPGIATPLIAVLPTAITITATPGDGQVTITESGGTGATSFALYRGTTATGSPIATSFPFTDTGRTNGTAVSYVATATNTAGTVTSSIVSATPTATPTLTNSVAPAVTPTTATTGTTLTTTNGTWSATPDSYTYQWRRGGTAISGATASTYTTVTGDLGNAITCSVTAVKAGYASGTATSNSVTPATVGTVTDTFDRADSATTLGSAQTGQAWVVTKGTWGISGNKAYNVSNTDDDAAIINTAVSNQHVSAVLTVGPTCLIARSDSTYQNAYMAYVDAGLVRIFSRVSGSYTILNSGSPTIASGDTVEFDVIGTALTIKQNGTSILTATDSTITTGTYAGMRSGGVTASRWDSFAVS